MAHCDVIESIMHQSSICANLISPKRSDDRGCIRERDVVIDSGGPQSLRERHTRIIHDTTFAPEIGADVHLKLIKEASAHSGYV